MTTTWLDEPKPGAACAVIAEVSQTHDGSLGTAHAFIDAAADAGADAIKFQTHIAAAETTPSEPWRTKFSRQDETRYEYWQRMEFSPEHWVGLEKHARERGLHFLSSPFSLEALELLKRVGVSAWKVASGEINNYPLLDAMSETGIPVILSTGMSPPEEIEQSVSRVRDSGTAVGVLQCSSMYPTPPELVGLNLIPDFRKRFGCAVGLSDHSATIYPGLAGAAMGIEILEIHIAFSREMFGPDVIASITTAELRQLVEGIRYIEAMRAAPVDKAALPESITSLRSIFMKSLVAAVDIPSGTILGEEHIASKKPGSGIPVAEIQRVIGMRLRRSVERDELLAEDDLEEVLQ
jgi:N-acetylneuraminate synthase